MGEGNIYKAIPSIMAEIGAIGKERKNAQQGYAYRGIDDFYNACQPLMVKYHVFSVPEVIDQKREERASKSGGLLIYTILTVKYCFYADDGSSVIAIVVGEGMDSGDKSTNKAMASAHKYALGQIFAVPTTEYVDPEQDAQEPIVNKPRQVKPQKSASKTLENNSEISKAMIEAVLNGDEIKTFHDEAVAASKQGPEPMRAMREKWRKVYLSRVDIVPPKLPKEDEEVSVDIEDDPAAKAFDDPIVKKPNPAKTVLADILDESAKKIEPEQTEIF